MEKKSEVGRIEIKEKRDKVDGVILKIVPSRKIFHTGPVIVILIML